MREDCGEAWRNRLVSKSVCCYSQSTTRYSETIRWFSHRFPALQPSHHSFRPFTLRRESKQFEGRHPTIRPAALCVIVLAIQFCWITIDSNLLPKIRPNLLRPPTFSPADPTAQPTLSELCVSNLSGSHSTDSRRSLCVCKVFASLD